VKFQTSIAASILFVSLASPSFAGQATVPITAITPLPILDRSIQVGHADQLQQMHVTVSMPFADSAAMEQYAESVSDPNSPNYRHFITPEQVGERFGISQERVQAISDYLESQGLTVTLVAKNRLTVSCEGTLGQIETAFGTTIDQYVIDPLISKGEPDGGNANFIAPSTDLFVPAMIADDIIGVYGLETYTKPEKRILTPTQTRALYDTAPLYGAGSQGQGRTIGISSWDGYLLSNIPLYYTKYALPTPAGGVGSNVHEVKISGGAGTGTAGGEADLDIQMVLGMAPLCEFYIYDGGSSDLVGVLTREVNDNLCDVISESYGWALSSSSAWTTPHNLHLSMTAQGITYMCASGDTGTTLGTYDYPNYDPEVLMVGGTTPVVNATTGVRTSEVGWSGSGGGWSTKAATFNKLPSWQVGTGVPTTFNYRLIPDLAFGANGTSGAYYFYFGGVLTSGYTGTSFACPVFAGMLGVAQQKIIALGGLPADSAGKRRMGRIQNLIYSQNGRTDVWYDVTSGSNGNLPSGTASSCTAKWDFVTGWGCMDVNAFVTTQNPLFTISTPNGVPTLILPAGGTTMNVTITPISGTVAAGSPKLFYKDSAASSWSSSLLTSTGGNNYVATFPAASCNSSLQFYIQATSGSGINVTLPTGGASTPYSATAAISSAVVLSDDFDGASSDFTVVASGDTATTGVWVRSAVLSGCGANTVSYSGTKAWVTASGLSLIHI
jgi:subtilase family serine protease